MNMAHCVVMGCFNRKEQRRNGLSFHRFPKDEYLRHKWHVAIGRRELPTSHSLICSEHFREEDFDRSSPFRVYLHRNAVPCYFPGPSDPGPSDPDVIFIKQEPEPDVVLISKSGVKVKSFANLLAMDSPNQNAAESSASPELEEVNTMDVEASFNSEIGEQPEDENLDDSDVCTLTLTDVLDMQTNLIEDTAAVLGAVSDKSCSYNEGYLKRQALYSCLTCMPEAKTDPEKRTGVCLACSYHCHDGHELIELYTKRNFRCDCGNSKFGDFKCNLLDEKAEDNELNGYNQNFSGIYCVCHRPYPDPEDPLPDEMIQCIICEDWYHSRHLGVALPADSFAEMICETCIRSHEFLLHYHEYCTPKTDNEEEGSEAPSGASASAVTVIDVDEDENETKDDTTKCTKPKSKCVDISAKFMQDIIWRKMLCTCDDCLMMYKNQGVLYLLDPDDPVHLYEEIGKAKAKEVIENHDRTFMNSVNRVQLIEAIAGYNELKENLAQYLKKFAENKKIVREEDIKEFFEGMKARKKQKTELPYFCR